MAQHITVLPPLARTATVNSRDFKNYEGGVGLVLNIVVTAAASPSNVVTIQGKDPSSGTYYTILASAAITGTGTTTMRVHPDLTAAANTVAKDMMPAVWRVSVTAGNGNSATYSIGASIV